MATYVLVHGGWSGAHGFRHVRKLIQKQGHEVFTPSLTGLGERAHLVSPNVNLSTHVLDVTNHILYEDLHDIVLMGFSYGGFVVTGALEYVHDRVKHLVYLDAFVPNGGETAFGLALGLGRPGAEIGATWLVPPSDREYDSPAEGEWMKSRRCPHPRACFTEPVFLSKPLEDFSEFSRTYIKATLDPVTDIGARAFQDAADRAKISEAWSYKEIATTHMVASNQPEALAKLLLEIVNDAGPSSHAVQQRQLQKPMTYPERIWVGPRYHEKRIFILGESWFGDFEGDLATDAGYIAAYLAGHQPDRLYTTLSGACGPDRNTFWEQVMFTNYVQRVGPTRAHRPDKSQYLEAEDRLRRILVEMQPRGVWVIGKEQGKYSAPVVREYGIPVVVVNHPSSHRGKMEILHEGLRASWQELSANAEKRRPGE